MLIHSKCQLKAHYKALQSKKENDNQRASA